tara:strand:+ start:170634 stop:171494 length:861 start_codon:yes stop_codon:yes gene_type:complete
MTKTPLPIVLLIGECQSPQFCRALSDGQPVSILQATHTHRVQSLTAAISLIGTGEFVPDLVVSYQSIPDEYSATGIDQLIGMLPLSRFVVAFSPWCESIGRTEQRWPSAWSVPLTHAAARIRFELNELAADTPPLPATSSRDEAFRILAAGCLESTSEIGQGRSAKVISADVPLKECFEQILVSVGFDVKDQKRPTLYVVVAAFIDDGQLHEVKAIHEALAIRQSFDATSTSVAILVASDMATPGDRIRLLEAGATAVISQLRFAEDLVDHFRSTTALEALAGNKM